MITVVDYGAGNIGSVLNMIKRLGGTATVAKDVGGIINANKILLPGVGSFDTAVSRLSNLGMFDALKHQAIRGIPFLGICLGMQLLSERSEEGSLSGLGLIPGYVKRFQFNGSGLKVKIPHMGWNTINILKDQALANNLDKLSRFYFVHSYYFECEQSEHKLFETTYGGFTFTSAVQSKNIMGVQFHPEKSHRYGMQLINNFINFHNVTS